MIVYGYGKSLLGALLTDYVLIQKRLDLLGRHEIRSSAVIDSRLFRRHLFGHDVGAQCNTLITDIYTVARDHSLDLIRTPAAEGADDFLP